MKNFRQTFSILTLILTMVLLVNAHLFSQTLSFSPAPIGGVIYICEGGNVMVTVNGTVAGETYFLNANPPDGFQSLTATGSSLVFNTINYPSTMGSPFTIGVNRSLPTPLGFLNQSVIVVTDPTPPTLTLSQATGTVCAGPNLSATLNNPGSDGNANVPGTNSFDYRINGGAWTPYDVLVGTPIPTTTYMLSTVEIRAKRSNNALGCSAENIYTWNINSNVHDNSGALTGSYCSIQQAIDAANTEPGDVLVVEAGTYTEEITLNKAITIQGANQGISAGAVPGMRGAESIIDGGFIVSAAATLNGLKIINGRTSGGFKVGVAVTTSGVTVTNSIIQDVLSPAQSDGLSTEPGNNNLTLTNSKIFNNWRGIYLNPGSGHVITGNLIDANNGVGVGIGSDGQSNLTLTGNIISNHTLEGWGASAVGSGVVATGNDFLNNGISIAHYGGSPINASCSDFGSNTYSDLYGDVQGAVVFVPYLQSPGNACTGTNALPASLGLTYTQASESILVQFNVTANALELQPSSGHQDLPSLTALYNSLGAAIIGGNPATIQAAALAVGDDVITEYYYFTDEMDPMTKLHLLTAAANPLVKNKYWQEYLVRNDDVRFPKWTPTVQTTVTPDIYRTSTNPMTGAVAAGWLNPVLGRNLHVKVTFVHNGTVNSVDQSIAIPAGNIENLNTGLGYPTIQAAINASSSGDRIAVKTGSYTENVDATAKNVTIVPGSSPGCVTINGNYTLGNMNTLEMEANSTVACTGYDQFTVNGVLTLGGATLNLTLGYAPVNGDQITLILNDGVDPVVGQFAQGLSITVSGHTFQINYAGGDGNDVVLTKCSGSVVNTSIPKSFCTIQDAINDPLTVDGHTITVAAGTYIEHVVVNKRLTIDGAGPGVTIVQGFTNGADVVRITKGGSDALNRTVIKDLSVASTGTDNNGIKIDASGSNALSYITIDNVHGTNLPGTSAGVRLHGTTVTTDIITDVKLDNVNFAFNNFGMYSKNAQVHGLTIDGSVSRSKFEDNRHSGILCEGNLVLATQYQNFDIQKTDLSRNNSIGDVDPGRAEMFLLGFNGNLDMDDVLVTSGLVTPNATPWYAAIAVNGKNSSGAAPSGIMSFNNMTFNSAAGATHFPRTSLGIWTFSNLNAGVTVDGCQFNSQGNGTHANNRGGLYIFSVAGTTPLVVKNSTFSGNYKYLTLPNDICMISSPVPVDASDSNTFTGAATEFAIEDRIYHAMDDVANGFVTRVASNDYVTTNNLGVQRGVNVASNGWTVNVNSGTYEQFNIDVNKSVNIRGANAGVACTGIRGSESIIQNLANNGFPVFNVTTDGVTLNGLEIINPWGNSAVDGSGRSNLSIIFNKIHNVGTSRGSGNIYGVRYLVGIATASNVTISDNCISNVANTTMALGNTGGLWFGQSDSPGTLSSLTIERNTISDINAASTKGAWGITIGTGSAAAGSIAAPVIRYNNITAITGGYSSAIDLTGKTPNAVVTNNFVNNINSSGVTPFAAGVTVGAANTGSTTLDINDNSFTNVLYGITNANAGAVNGTCNWYGSASGNVVAPKILGNVNYISWLVNGTNNASGTGFFQTTPDCSGTPVFITSAIPSPNQYCQNDGEIDVVFNGGTGTYTVAWTGGTPVSGIAGSPYTITGLTNGSYTITVTDINGTWATTSATVSNQPVRNNAGPTYYATIQAAIDAASPGHTIEVCAGTYNERVIIDKSLTLQGVNEANVIINGSSFGDNGNGITINNGVTNVNIRYLTVQNFKGLSGNANGGIYAIGGNNNLLVEHVTIKDNRAPSTSGSGFYANGPVTGVTLDYVTSTGHYPGARGIVIWNGLKSNITISNCHVYNNNCCGIELQDGFATGVTMNNNNVHDNGDSGMSALGLQGPGVNVISNNTVTNNGRFGIEIKNPNGSGAVSGAGSIVVSNNTVSRTPGPVFKFDGITSEVNDLAGICVIRRMIASPPVAYVDVPYGVQVNNNSVSGYVQPSNSDGFGIVLEGINHTATGNTLNGNDVGIQRQAGHLPYPGEGDQSNLADTYFGRGNSPVSCGINISGTINGNVLANTLNSRDVGNSFNSGIVVNTNTNKSYCSIQSAINDVTTIAGHVITVSSGTYNEQVLVNKGVKILGVGATKPLVDFTGTVTGKPTLFDVSVDGVTIENINFNVDLSKLRSAVIASAAGLDAITIKDNTIGAYGTPAGSYTDRNAVSVNYSGSINYRVATGGVNSVIFTGNTVNGTGPGSYFRSGISLDEGGLTATGNTLTTINHDILLRFASNGANTITGNNFNGGGLELSEQNAGSGPITVSGNTFTGVGAPNTAVLRLKNNNLSAIAHNISSNVFNNYEWAISAENMRALTLNLNTFNTASTTAHAMVINTKSLSSNSNTTVQIPLSATITNNNFNGTGNAITFLNHDSDNDSYGSIVLGTLGNENNFSGSLSSFVVFDGQTGTTDATMSFPIYPISNPLAVPPTPSNLGWPTTKACWDQNLNAQNNKFDVGSGLQLPTAMTFAGRTTLESKLTHDPDNVCLGLITYFLPVHNVTQNTFYLTIQEAVNAAVANNVIKCSEWTYNENVVIDKPLTIEGLNSNRALQILDGTNIAAGSNGFTINSNITGVTIKNFTIQNFIGTGGNSAGIKGVMSNSDLMINNVDVKNNTNSAGIHLAAISGINNVTITNSASSNHGPGARGIVIWDGLKTNINISNNTVTNNNCCGIELQDGDASAVTISNNTIDIGNGDNAIGLTGLNPSVGANLINLNTITGGGRFGIEIKNPAGGVTVSNNNVSLTTVNTDRRDRAGIAVFRRGVLNNNVDVPNGVMVSGNTVTGYVQNPLYDEGFGIVVEGTNHTVTGNTISNCNVGIQQQGGAHPNANYPAGDGAQGASDQLSTSSLNYFGRGNSPFACGNVIEPNTFGTFGLNGIDTRNVISANNLGLVTNTSNGETFCNIQAAIDDAQTVNGHTLTVAAGTYAETINLNKSVTLRGPNHSLVPCVDTRVAEAIITGGLNVTAGITMTVVIEGFHFQGVSSPFNYNGNIGTTTLTATFRNNLVNSSSGQMAAFVGATDNANLTISNNCFQNMASNAMQLGGGNFVTQITGNIINTTVNSGINTDAIVNSSISNNTISNTGQQGIQVAGFSSNVNVFSNVITNANTTLGVDRGGIRIRGINYTGPVDISNNIISGSLNGIAVANGENITGKLITVNDNKLSGNTASVYHGGTGSLNAECNWHGSVNYNIILAQLAGSGASDIDFVSYLSNDTDTDGAMGFQPSLVACSGTPVAISATSTPNQYCQTNGSITVDLSGGLANYRVDWSGAASGASDPNPLIKNVTGPSYVIPSLPNGNYTITVTDTNGSSTTTAVAVVNHPVWNFSASTYHPTIQAAIDAALPTHIIEVCAGTYVENIIVTKELDIRGANYNVNPNTGIRGSESILMTSIIEVAGSNNSRIVAVDANNVKINGFLIDGDNPALTSGYVNNVGADMDIRNGIDNAKGIQNLRVENNIFKNMVYYGVRIQSTTGLSPAVSSGHEIHNNRFMDMGTYQTVPSNIMFPLVNGWGLFGGGVLLQNSHYAKITNNVMLNVRIGVQLGNFQAANPNGLFVHTIDNNEIQARRIGIFYNLLRYSPWTVSNNEITGLSSTDEGTIGGSWRGLRVTSVGLAGMGTSTFTNNDVDGSAISNINKEGINVWNVTDNSRPIFNGGTITGVNTGAMLMNHDASNVNAVDGAHATLTNVNISATGVGVHLLDSPSSTTHAKVNATVSGVTISGGVEGIKLEGDPILPSAAVGGSFTGNTISATAAGINVTRSVLSGTNGLTITGNTITNASQLASGTPTIGISLNNISGSVAANIGGNIIGNNIEGPYFGYLIYNLKTDLVTTITGDVIKSVMQGVKAVNTLDNVNFAPSVFNLSGQTMSDFKGDHGLSGINFHAGVYTFTGGAAGPNSITANITDVSVNGTGRIAQDCAGLSFVDFSTGSGTMQNIKVRRNTLTENLNRGINIRGNNALIDISTSTLDGNGRYGFNLTNIGFGLIARQGAVVTIDSSFIKNPEAVTDLAINVSAIGADPGSAGSVSVTATHNSIIQNNNATSKLVNNAAGGTVNATCNWWGSAVAANVTPHMAGVVTYQPFLTIGTDVSGDPGFQPVPNSCNACISGVLNTITNISYCTIQQAINDINTLNGHTIMVAAGTYTENVTVNKALTIKGANFGTAGCATRVAESTVAGGLGTAFTVTSSGVTIDGFEITGATGVVSVGATNVAFRNNKISVTAIGVNAQNIATSAGNTLTVEDNCITLSSQLAGANPTTGVFVSGATGTHAVVMDDNTVSGAFYGYVLYGLNTTAASVVSDGTVNGAMQGVAMVNTLDGTIKVKSNVAVSGMTMSGFAGAHPTMEPRNFHAGIYTFTTLGTLPAEGITLSVSGSTVNGTQTVTQASGGIYLADFSGLAATVQTVTVDECNIINNTNRGLDARGRVNVTVTESTFTNNGGAAFGSLGNDGFTMIAQQGATINAMNNFITHPATSTTPVTAFLTGNGPANTIIANNNSVLKNGNVNGRGASNVGGSTIDVTCNWWGTTLPSAVSALMSGTVSHVTWLISGVDGNLVAAGFQPSIPCEVCVPGDLATSTIGASPLVVAQNSITTPTVAFTGVGGTAPYTFTYNVSYNAGPAGPTQTLTTISGDGITIPQPNNIAGTFTYSLLSVTEANGCTYTFGVPPTVTITVIAGNVLPDLAPSIARPLNASFVNLQMKEGYVQFTNGGNGQTVGNTVYRISKISGAFSVVIDNTVMTYSGQNVINHLPGVIIDGSSPLYYTITYPYPVLVGVANNIKIGFRLTATGFTGSESSLTASILEGSGFDSNKTNNSATRKFVVN